MIRSYSLEALILKKDKMGETDSRLTVFSRRLGKAVFLAKGVRKIASRRSPYLDLFNHLRLFISKGKSFDIITDVILLDNYPVLKSDIKRVANAFKMAELLVRLLPEGQSQEEIFKRILKDFNNLNNPENSNFTEITTDFSNFLLGELGYSLKDSFFQGTKLDSILEEVMEKKISTNRLLSKLL